MRTSLWIAAALTVSGVAHAGYRVTPPKGWKTAAPDEAKALVDADESAVPGSEAQAQIWENAGGGHLEVRWIRLPPLEDLSPSKFVSDMAASELQSYMKRGAKGVRAVSSAGASGQIFVENDVRFHRMHVMLVERGWLTPSGRFELLAIECDDRTDTACRKAIDSATLTVDVKPLKR